jgi:hypothetical protein
MLIPEERFEAGVLGALSGNRRNACSAIHSPLSLFQ